MNGFYGKVQLKISNNIKFSTVFSNGTILPFEKKNKPYIMCFSSNYNNNYCYPSYILDATFSIANEENAIIETEDDLTIIVEHILSKYLKNKYHESEKEELCHKLEMIIQDQANYISHSQIAQQNITSFTYNQHNPYSNPMYLFYNDCFLQLYNPNSKQILNPIKKITRTSKVRYLTRKKNGKHKKASELSEESIKKQAEKGDVESMIKYGIMLREGNEVKVDERESIRFFKKAADNGSSQGMAEYALTLVLNEWIPCNKSEVVEYCKRSVEMGNTDALRVYGLILAKGFGIPKNSTEAVRYFKMAIEKGHTGAMSDYAYMLKKGEGIPKNSSEAIRYYKMAIDKGDTSAMNGYAFMLKLGEGIPKNSSEAARYFKMAIDKGNTSAMNNYAYMLEKGEGIPKNSSEAVRYYKMAIEKGNKSAMGRYESIINEWPFISVT